MNRAFRNLALAAGGVLAAVCATRTIIRQQRFFDLRGKVAVVSGGSRGLGLELARQLCLEGARVAICARDEAELRRAREECDGEVFAGVCDITDRRQVHDFVDQVRRELGPVDVLINNAGVITVGPFDTINREEAHQSFATHVSAPLEFIRAVLPDMRQRGGGRIVNVASIGGKVPVPHMASYTASKHALVGLSEALRAELVHDNIYLTLVCPGLMRTGSPRHARFKGEPEKEFAWFAAMGNEPAIAVSPRRMASRILQAMQHGQAVLIWPWNARLAIALHGVFAGVTTELAGLQAWLLPAGRRVRRDDEPLKGYEADVGQLPGRWQSRQRASAKRHNET